MKRLILTILLLSATTVFAQKVAYAYDQAGNRIARTIVLQTRAAAGQNKEDISFNEHIAGQRISLYPNPVKTTLSVRIDALPDKVEGKYTLYNMQGKSFVTGNITNTGFDIDMSRLVAGVYILRIYIGKDTTSWKIIKQ